MSEIVNFLYKFIDYFLEVIKFYIVGKYILAWKEKKWNQIRGIVAGIGLIGISIYFCYYSNYFNPIFFYSLFLILEVFIVFEEAPWKKVLVTLTVIYVIGYIDVMVHGLYEVFFGFIAEDMQIPMKGIVSVTTIVFLGMISYAINYKNQGYVRKIPMQYYMIFIVLATGNGIILGVFESIIEKGNVKGRIAYIFIVLGVFLELAFILILAATREVYKEKDVLNQKYLKWQEEHYTYLEQRETTTKKFRHDMRNHIYILQHLLKQGEIESAKIYIDEIEEHFNAMGTPVSVNHGIVDAILNKYAAMCEERKIHLKIKGYMPQNCKISSFDLCVIFSNLLSNAMEAAEQCMEKRIFLELRHEEDTFMLCVRNTFDGKLVKRNGKIQTSKYDTQTHGYGLENIKECVEKNCGYMEIREETHFFVLQFI